MSEPTYNVTVTETTGNNAGKTHENVNLTTDVIHDTQITNNTTGYIINVPTPFTSEPTQN